MEPEPKISVTETIFIGLFFASIDAFEFSILWFGGDDFWFFDAFSALIFFYLFLKDIPPFRQLINWILELFPYVGGLPLLTLGWAWTVWADWHPSGIAAQALQVAETAASVKGAGKTPAGGEGGAAAGGAAAHGAEQEAARSAEQGAAAGAKAEGGSQAGAAEKAQQAGAGVSEEAFGVEKEPMEKVKELMEKPLPENSPPPEEEPREEPPKVEDVRRKETL